MPPVRPRRGSIASSPCPSYGRGTPAAYAVVRPRPTAPVSAPKRKADTPPSRAVAALRPYSGGRVGAANGNVHQYAYDVLDRGRKRGRARCHEVKREIREPAAPSKGEQRDFPLIFMAFGTGTFRDGPCRHALGGFAGRAARLRPAGGLLVRRRAAWVAFAGTAEPPWGREPRKGVLLAVGGVSYDRNGASSDKAGKPWPVLSASDKERAAVVVLVRKLAAPPEIVERSGADADVTHLLKDLPRARWAHLATHGFFAAPDTKEREHLFLPGDFRFGVRGTERQGATARNPLTQSGLVLAGANQPTDADPGLLTGEVIAGLDLDGLDLAVLSVCRTGLGEQYNGEGVFGLQRGFHIAGAKNVVASLWTVDDESTAALMNLFYYHLWEKNEPPLEALHHAQLELYRNPQGVPALARGRGAADWDETMQVVTKPPADPKAAPQRPAAVRDWAAFVLSGAGR